MSDEYTPEQYERAKASLADPNLNPQSKAIRSQRIAAYEKSSPVRDVAKPSQDFLNWSPEAASKEPVSVILEKPAAGLDAAQKQGYSLDLTNPDAAKVIQPLAGDPKQYALMQKVREATEDQKLPNSSKLKVFNDPADYRPAQPGNPFSPLGAMLDPFSKPTQYFYEPSVTEFKQALQHGALKKQLQKEFPAIPDPLKLIDANLEDSKTFKAFQDAAWKHSLADAIKNKTPISRVEYSTEVGPVEKAQAKALDYATAGATGALRGYSFGLSDPLIRAVAPETAEAESLSRTRHPNVAMGGTIAGALSPSSGPAKLAAGTTKVLGKLGLEGSGLANAVRGVASGAATGAMDANLQAIAQSASDALDAGDTAVEAAKRIYQTMNSPGALRRTLEGGATGGVLSGGGEALGGLAGKGARALVGGDARDMLLQGENAGLKMSPLGSPVVPKDLSDLAATAASKGGTAENAIAQKLSGPLSRQRLLEQEAMHRGALEDTARARESLQEPAVVNGSMTTTEIKVPTHGAASKIKDLAKNLSDLTPQGGAKANELRAIAKKLASRQAVSAPQIDADIDALEARAKSTTKEPDPDFLAAKKILLDLRDELHMPDESTSVDSFAIRDKEGNVKPVDGYSALKAGQARQKTMYEVENTSMGLPTELKGAPVRIAKAPNASAAQAVAESATPEVKFGPNQREGFEGRIATAAEPNNAVRFEQYRDLAAREGLGNGEKLQNLRRLRAAQNWKQYLGRAINGISPTGNTYIRANNLLRLVPSLKSISGGAPPVEATDQAVRLVDRFLANSVPEWKGANLRGGQAARSAGSIAMRNQETPVKGDMTDEEARAALTIIKNLVAMEGI